MAGDWIKMRTDLYRDPKVIVMTNKLRQAAHHEASRDDSVTRDVMRHAVVGALVSVWGVARHKGERDDETGDDMVLRHATLDVLDEIVHWDGFGIAMQDVGWVSEENGNLLFPRFFATHNVDPSDRKKQQDRERARAYRERKKRDGKHDEPRTPSRDASRDDHVTVTHREEKRREENIYEGTNVPSVDRVDGEEASTERIPKSEAEKDRDREIEAETRKIVDAWNQLPGARAIRSLNHKRRAAVRSRLLAGEWPWREAMDKFPLRCFESSDGYVPTFDFFVRPDTVNSILEGKYDWEHENGTSTSHKQAGIKQQRNFEAAVGFVRRQQIREESDEALALEGPDEPIGRVG